MGKAKERGLRKWFFLVLTRNYKPQCNTFVFCVFLLCFLFVLFFFISGRCGTQNKLIALSGMIEGAGIKESTAAAVNAGKGPTVVDKKASTISQIMFQKGIRL